MAEPEGPQTPPILEGDQDHPSSQAPQALQQPTPNMPHFKPKFSGKPEDAEAHLLRTND